MRQATINIYKFSELPEKTKKKVLDNWRLTGNYCHNFDEEMDSIKAFCDHFGVKLTDWQIGAYAPFHYKTNAESSHFRGRKLKDFNPDHMPTGLYLDCSLWGEFYKHFEKTGDCKGAFEAGLRKGFKSLQDEMESRDSDEYIIEEIEYNDLEFYDDGREA